MLALNSYLPLTPTCNDYRHVPPPLVQVLGIWTQLMLAQKMLLPTVSCTEPQGRHYSCPHFGRKNLSLKKFTVDLLVKHLFVTWTVCHKLAKQLAAELGSSLQCPIQLLVLWSTDINYMWLKQKLTRNWSWNCICHLVSIKMAVLFWCPQQIQRIARLSGNVHLFSHHIRLKKQIQSTLWSFK